jgi:hypothetical protein
MAGMCVPAVHAAAGRFDDPGRAPDPRVSAPEPDWLREADRAHPPRALTTRAEFTARAGSWRARVEHRLTLHSDDPLLAPLRRGESKDTAEHLDDRLAGDVRYTDGTVIRAGGGMVRRLAAPSLTRQRPDGPAVVTWTLEETCRAPCAWDGVFRFAFRPAAGPVPRHTTWTVDLRAHGTDLAVTGVRGAVPERQTGRSARLRPLTALAGAATTVTVTAVDAEALGFARQPSAETGPRFLPTFDEPLPVALGIVLGFTLIGGAALYGMRSLRAIRPPPSAHLRVLLWIFTTGGILLALAAWESPRLTAPWARSLLGTTLITWWGVIVPVGLLFLLPALQNVLNSREGDRKRLQLHEVEQESTALGFVAVTVGGAAVEGVPAASGAGGAPLGAPLLAVCAAAVAAALVPAVLPVPLRWPAGPRRVWWCAIAAAMAVAACVVASWGRLAPPERIDPHLSEGLLLVGLGLLWVPTLVRAAQLAGKSGRRWTAAALAAGLLLYLPADAGRAFEEPRTLLAETTRPRLFEATLVDIAFHTVGGLIVVAIPVMVYRRWHANETSAERHARTLRKERAAALAVAFVALTVNPVVAADRSNVVDVLPVAAALGGFSLLLYGNRRRSRAVRLARVDRVGHSALVRAYARWTLLQSAQHALFQQARGDLAGGGLTPQAAWTRWRSLDRGTRPPPLVTGGGRSPWQNAVHAAAVAALLAAPVMGIELYSVRKLLPELTLGQLLVLLEHTLRWSAYGAFFGYFCTRLPGRTPVMKSQFLLGALLVPELLLLFFPYSRQVTDLGLASGLRVGWLIVFCLVLGMYWEWHLVRLAGLPWRLVRSFRTLATLTAPVTAVVVATVTAVATGLTGAASVAVTQQPTNGTLQVETAYSVSTGP